MNTRETLPFSDMPFAVRDRWARGETISRLRLSDGDRVEETTRIGETDEAETLLHVNLDYIPSSTSKNGRSRLYRAVSYSLEVKPKQAQQFALDAELPVATSLVTQSN